MKKRYTAMHRQDKATSNRLRQIKQAEGRIQKAFSEGREPNPKDFAIKYMRYEGWVYVPGEGVKRENEEEKK